MNEAMNEVDRYDACTHPMDEGMMNDREKASDPLVFILIQVDDE